MVRVSKTRSRVHQQDQRPSSTQTSVEIPSNLGELSILELKSLCRKLNFSCAGGRGTYNASTERKRTSKHKYATIQPSNRSSKQHVIYFQREGKLQCRPTGADYRDCFTVDLVIVRKPTCHNDCDLCRWTANYPATATRKARTAWSIPIFKFQQAPTAADFIPLTCCLNPASRWGIHAPRFQANMFVTSKVVSFLSLLNYCQKI